MIITTEAEPFTSNSMVHALKLLIFTGVAGSDLRRDFDRVDFLVVFSQSLQVTEAIIL
jgi:hypothetical protein